MESTKGDGKKDEPSNVEAIDTGDQHGRIWQERISRKSVCEVAFRHDARFETQIERATQLRPKRPVPA